MNTTERMASISKALQLAVESARLAADAYVTLARVVLDYCAEIIKCTDLEKYAHDLNNTLVKEALLREAPPKVRHLALHAKKARTRKKNLNRAKKLRKQRMKQENPRG